MIVICAALVTLLYLLMFALCRASKDADEEAERLFCQFRHRQERERLP